MADKPEDLQTSLDDFRSRLQWGLLLQLPGSGDQEIREILRRRASLLGFELSDEVIAYLMTHYARNLASQMSILQRLDGVSLSQQRKVTIPLVKQALLDRPE
ncbi:MAG: DnaA/Hda family protein, partial [Gammaproteobacteria bacterium]|nr:DnaA/Hda family protein [Gammaproteobacteria bacterium]